MPNNQIALAIKAPEFDDPIAQYAKVAQIGNMIQQSRANAQQMERTGLQIEEQRRKAADDENWRGAFTEGGGDPLKTVEAAQRRGVNPTTIQTFKKQWDEDVERKGKLKELDFKNRDYRTEAIYEAHKKVEGLAEEQRPLGWKTLSQELSDSGVIAQKDVEDYDPERFPLSLALITGEKHRKDAAAEKRLQAAESRAVTEEIRRQQDQERENKKAPFVQTEAEAAAAIKVAQSKGEELEQPREKATRLETERRNKELAEQAAARLRMTKRGQDMTDARARELAEAARENKPPTAAQSTVATYAARSKKASETIDRLEQGFSERMFNKLVPDFASFLRTEKGQAFDQARRDFINASLRRESGAVINAQEFVNANQQYIPQPGDTAATKKQKRENRQIQTASFKRAAGKAYADPEQLLQEAAGAATVKPAADLTGLSTEELFKRLQGGK